MPFYLPEFGALPFAIAEIAAGAPDIPWYQSDKFLLVPLVLLFGAGLLLGYILFHRTELQLQPETGGEEEGPNLKANLEGVTSTDKVAELRREIEADFERSRAELQGEKDAAQALIAQQRDEIQRRDEKLALTQNQFEEKQRRLEELTALTAKSPTLPANEAALINARASVIQLSETIKVESQQVGSGLTLLEQIEERVTDQKDQVWEGIETVAVLRNNLEKDGGRRCRDLTDRLRKLEDQLRVHHQNTAGCIEQTNKTRTRLRDRQSQLRNALQPISCVEKRLVALEETFSTDPSSALEKWTPELEASAFEIEHSQELISGYQNGIRQEISALNDRIDWLMSDSTLGFFKAMTELKEAKLPRNSVLRAEFFVAERQLIATRESLTHMSETIPPCEFEFSKSDHHRIDAGFSSTIQILNEAAKAGVAADFAESAIAKPAIDASVLESQMEDLRTQLDEERKSASELQRSLEENKVRLSELEAEAAERGNHETVALSPMPLVEGKNFMRRLLGLGPSRRDQRRVPNNEWEEGMTGPQLAIADLKSLAEFVENTPLEPVSLPSENGNGGEISSLKETLLEKENRISELESEIRQLTAPIPFPSELGIVSEGEPEISKPSFPEVTILPLTPTRFADEPVAAKVEEAQTVIFRGDDPKTWNTDYFDSQGNFATPLADIAGDIKFINLKRLDTEESVTLPISREELISGSAQQGNRGWSGKAEHYFGSMHLGIFDETVPHEVETKFGAGGWGFGHRYEIGSGQAFAWAGKEIPPVKFEISVGINENTDSTIKQGLIVEPTLFDREPEEINVTLPPDGIIIFRSNNPALWNSTVYRGMNQRALAVSELPKGDAVQWLKLKRCDTGDAVILPITLDRLEKSGNGNTTGFNGANEQFYGAYHLGVYDSKCPLDVETRFTFGGWGFGHSNLSIEDSQAWGWGGVEIPVDTVFEMTVFAQMPEISEKDLVLQQEK